jgi:histidine triad (HIT) family protein
MQESLFTKIIRGDIPSHKIYEDDDVYAFLDIHPVTKGHTLVIPKKQVEFVWDLDQPDYQALTNAAKKIAVELRRILDVPYVGQQIVGTDVPHAHIHLIPFVEADQYHHQPDQNQKPDHSSLSAFAQHIRDAFQDA